MAMSSACTSRWNEVWRSSRSVQKTTRDASEALLATGERWLTHVVRKDSRTFSGAMPAFGASAARVLRGDYNVSR